MGEASVREYHQGQWLKAKVERSGRSNAEFARDVGVRREVVQRWFNQHEIRMRRAIVWRVLDALRLAGVVEELGYVRGDDMPAAVEEVPNLTEVYFAGWVFSELMRLDRFGRLNKEGAAKERRKLSDAVMNPRAQTAEAAFGWVELSAMIHGIAGQEKLEPRDVIQRLAVELLGEEAVTLAEDILAAHEREEERKKGPPGMRVAATTKTGPEETTTTAGRAKKSEAASVPPHPIVTRCTGHRTRDVAPGTLSSPRLGRNGYRSRARRSADRRRWPSPARSAGVRRSRNRAGG
jgi:hypothetical protein